MNIVKTNIPYNSDILTQNIHELLHKYPFLNVQTVGLSVLKKPIYVIRLGRGRNNVFYSGGIHGNEWITTPLLMKFVEDYCIAHKNNSNLYNTSIRRLFNSTSIYIMPMVNPDGVDLVTDNLNHDSKEYLKAKSISNNYPNIPFPDGWKANINGVDLNLQFPAGWENAREIKFAQGFTSPAPRDFVGNSPLSEPESQAIYEFTLSHNFRLVLAYHTQGKEIYWQFVDYNPPKSREIGQKFSSSSGYLLADTPYASSFAGYKDWFIQKYNKPRIHY